MQKSLQRILERYAVALQRPAAPTLAALAVGIVVVVAGCGKHTPTTDAEIAQAVVGTWNGDSRGEQAAPVYAFQPDGTMTMRQQMPNGSAVTIHAGYKITGGKIVEDYQSAETQSEGKPPVQRHITGKPSPLPISIEEDTLRIGAMFFRRAQ